MVYVFELNKKYDIDGGVLRNHARNEGGKTFFTP